MQERIYKNYQSIEFRPHNFTQYLLSSEVGFSKCEVLSIPPHPAKGFQRPIHLFTKADLSQDDFRKNMLNRQERRDEERRKLKEYERKLFKKEDAKEGNMSEISQQSNESMSQYDQLENVYAPSATPCYDTLGHNNDNQTPDASKMCYVDVNIETDKIETDCSQIESNVTSESVQPTNKSTKSENQTFRKRNIETEEVNNAVDTKKPKNMDGTMIRSIPSEIERITDVKEEDTSISISSSRSGKEQRRDESSSQSTVEKHHSSDRLNERNDEEERSEKDSKTKGWEELGNGLRSRCSKRQTERQHCELISDNT